MNDRISFDDQVILQLKISSSLGENKKSYCTGDEFLAVPVAF
jgi:hypothetical protein